MARLEIVNDAAWNARVPDGFPCSLHVRTQDGHAHVVEVPYPPGFSRGQLEPATVIKKFEALTAPHVTAGRARPHHRSRDGARPEHRPAPS